jgi:hypothetical protein
MSVREDGTQGDGAVLRAGGTVFEAEDPRFAGTIAIPLPR